MSDEPQFKLINRHDSGLYGVVWEGWQTDVDRKVALKFLKLEVTQLTTARDHARALAKLNHQNIVTVYALGKVTLPNGDVQDAIVMEWLEGKTVGDMIAAGGITRDEAFSIMRGVLSGLRYMHLKGMMHGDLHAGNVLIGSHFVKIIDISASDPTSMARYSTMTEQLRRSSDVAYVTGMIRQILNRCIESFSEAYDEINKLASVQTLDEVGEFIEKLDSIDSELSVPVIATSDPKEDVLSKLGLQEADIKVLKIIGDIIKDENDNLAIAQTNDVIIQGVTVGLTRDDVRESIDYLGEKGFFVSDQNRYSVYVQLSTQGLDYYLMQYYRDYENSKDKVTNYVAAHDMPTDRDIAAATSLKKVIVQHFLGVLEEFGFCSTSRTNMGVRVHSVTREFIRKHRTKK